MSEPLLVRFAAGPSGLWSIEAISAYIGASLPPAARLSVAEGWPSQERGAQAPDAAWTLNVVTSHTRYTGRDEVAALRARQEGLGRPGATRAALIPIRKNAHWWALAQDERRAILEERSRHIRVGLEYLPAVARRLHHSRELGTEPFDFLTWFEYAPQDAPAFEELVQRLRDTEEWRYVEREVDIRLVRDEGA